MYFKGSVAFGKRVQARRLKLELEPDAEAVAQKPRPVPYHLQKPLKDWLDQGVKEEIFEKVPDGEAITWLSTLVVQPKPKFTGVKSEELDSHMIKASIDRRIPNQQGYHQLALNPSTRQVATFSTRWGKYIPQRLVFGAKSSQDVFDEAMFRIFGNIPHCLNQRDDKLLGGRDQIEHRKVLKTGLKKARDHEITFNRERCEFGKDQIEFFGHVFTKDGLKPSPDRVRAIHECGMPENKEAVRSFLGMAGYPGQSHTELCRHSSTTIPAKQKGNQILLG
ncbi:hypothetical protein ACROYT_G018723 [Oculina patagonica]